MPVFFCFEKRGKNMKSKTIYCPCCNRKVAEHNGIGTTKIEVRCKKCGILVVYIPSNGTTTISDVPQRTTASGKRFY